MYIMSTLSEYIEDIIKRSGGFGRFQLLLCVIILGSKISVTWTTLMMAFAGAIPDWWCNHDITDSEISNTSYKSCMANSTTKCNSYKYNNEMYTLVNEFDLVCDKDWITATVTTIQFGGLLVGCFTMGHLADLVGRKPIYFLSLLILCVMNVVAYFSVSWQMFAVVRFVLGFGAGTYLTVYFPLMMEFISQGARPVIAGLPSWTMWAALLGLVSYLLPNWKHLHLATAVATAPWLLAWWFVPESFRWLVSNNRLHNAEKVIERIAKINNCTMLDLSDVDKVMLKEENNTQNIPFSCGYVYYAISFGVQKLSGSLYLNLFLLSAVEIPGNAVTMVTSH
ncbi:hypothetical protein KUTeg_022387 [Tegillarca granosa]|uniref:Major facilitator superfamily (MFS) profile domain-containing protein n=1 Tax=Tegillarca granosa TaxID=220873 RepID=A0ABQ9EC93_TEGGR|nr:hypothetical protein KUTeg_022387 [Tegillarca granosa]